MQSESLESVVVRKNNTKFWSSTVESKTAAVSQQACEDSLLNSATAVAYSFDEQTQYCELLSGISEMIPSNDVQSGAAINEFPWLCNLHCQDDPRWDWTTGVIRVSRYTTNSCQCCLNFAAPSTNPEVVTYRCSSGACELCHGTDPWASSIRIASRMSWLVSLLALASAVPSAEVF
eukprot:Skav231470  [mRNA]  locus=scaffold1100:382368:382895:- [translate_table: standard]